MSIEELGNIADIQEGFEHVLYREIRRCATLFQLLNAMKIVNELNPERVWWLALIAIVVAALFSLMFNNFIKRYTARILSFPERKKSLFAFFDLRGYILIIFMMGLGISLKFIPGIPTEFFAGFYPGLGTALTIAGIRYFVRWWKTIRESVD